ncbi:MAG: phosphatidylserine decarboxylase [Acidobacteria bacterium]|nr:phosphatidylserine decarboxylase [Acidobacteriota bacterium]
MAKDGLRFLIPLALLTALSFVVQLPALGLVFLALTLFMAFFFRDPERETDEAEDRMIAPADGKVIWQGEEANPLYPENRCKKLSIFLSPWDVHVNRSPVDGLIRKVVHQRGQFKAAFLPETSEVNEQNVIEIQGRDTTVVMKQIAGILARRCVLWVREGETVRRGQRIGMIRFGSRTDVLMPAGAEFLVQLGEKVKAGETAIARISPPAGVAVSRGPARP